MIKPVQMIIAVFVMCMFVFPAAADYQNSQNSEKMECTYHLTSGWNMISLPVASDNATVSGIFGDNVSMVFSWTGTEYKNIPLDEKLEPKKGYWVLTNTTSDYNVTGSRIADTSIALNSGWNLVGLVSSGVSVGSLTDITSVLEWTGTEYKELNKEQVLELTKAYWMLAIRDVVILTCPVISVNAPDTVSGTFDAVIDITNVINLDSVQFDLSFNADVVNVTGVDSGSIGATEVTVDDWSFLDDNTIRVLINLSEASGVSGSGSLATIHFTVTGSNGDTCTLIISDGLLVDTDAVPINAIWFGDDITVEEITAVSPVEVTVNAPETVSGTFDAVIDITNVTNLDSGQFDLSFNADVVNVTGVDPGSIGATEVPVDNWSFIDNDTIRVLINLSEASGVSGSGSLATIHFTVTGSAGDNCTLDISDGLLVDTDAVSINALWLDDDITVGEITAVSPVEVTVNAPDTVSGTFDAVIDITNVTNLDSGQFDLSFDPNIIGVVDVKPGRIERKDVPVDMWRLIDEGRIRVLFNIPGATGVSGSGKLARINFEVTGSVGNTSVLAISNGSLVNTSALNIPANWTDDEITVTAPVEININAPDIVSGTFDAVIDITNITNFDSAQFDLSFNADVVNVTGVDPGSIGTVEIPVDDWTFIDNDTIRVLINLPETAGVSGSGSLATIHFTVTGSAGDNCTLDISDGLLVDTDAVPIYALWFDSEITVEGITAGVPISVNAPEIVSGSFNATIDVENVTDMNGGQFDLSFDPNVVNVTNVTSGIVGDTEIPLPEWNFIDNSTIRVISRLPNANGMNGSGYIAKIHFNVTGSPGDTSVLDISNGIFSDTGANRISVILIDDEVTVEGNNTVQVIVNAPDSVSGTFNATIDITDVVNLDSGQFDLSFDANVVNVTGVDSGSIGETEIRLESWTFMDSDTIRILFNLPGAAGVSGSGSLATIHFTVTGTAGDTSILDISDGLLVDIESEQISTLWSDDEVSI